MPEAPAVGTCPVCGTGGCRHLTDDAGLEYVACYLGDSGSEKMTMSLEGMALLFPSSDTFNLSSRPLANHTIYLDFNGHVTFGTKWNNGATGTFSTPAYSLDADFKNFSSTEHAAIQEIWARVAEDFAPFDVNVTTYEPDLFDLSKGSSSDQRWGVRVVIGGDGAWYNDPRGTSAAGVAYTDSFNWNDDTPCFVFAGQSWNANLAVVASSASHEAGHTLGLGHDGHTGSGQYYGGRGSWFSEVSWGPIMGNPGFSQPISLTQWSKGDYGGATNFEDDLAIITTRNGFGYRPDDHGNSFAAATRINNIGSTFTAKGLIHTAGDVDVFAFESNGTLLATISPAAVGANLDVSASLWNAAGSFVAASNPIDRIGASFSLNVVPGLYYLVVGGTGMGDPATTGYTSYGSLGQYTVDVNRGSLALPVVSVVASDPTAAEGSPADSGRFTISRSGAATDRLLVSFGIGGTATEGVDYARLSDVEFAPGVSSVFVFVDVIDDTVVEGSETVTLTLAPTFVYTVGSPSSATVTIADNDFAPEIELRGNGFSISDGDTTPSTSDHTDFSGAPIAGGMLSRTFTIINSGSGALLLSGSPRVQVSGTHAGDFSVITTPPSSVAAGSSTTFEVRFAPSAAGLRSARISIANNDANENPFDFSIQGTGTLVPEIDVRGNGFSISDGDTTPSSTDHTDFGNVSVAGSTLTRTFTVANSGSAALALTGSPRVQITGSHAGDFSISVLPTSPLQAGSSTTFQVRFDPSAAGLRTARISIANDDADENPYDFSIMGTGTLPPAPEIDVRGNGVSLTSGDATPSSGDNTDFGSTTIASGTVFRTFMVTNAGTATLTLSGSPRVQITGSHASDFSVVTQPVSPLAANATTHFEVQFRPSAAGLRVGRVVIANDDADENPFEFAIQGTGMMPLVPEIDLRGNGVSIIDGDITPSTADHTDFGTTGTTGGTVTRTFTVANTGTSTLSLTGSPLVQLTGSHANDFTVISSPGSTVGAGSATTFQVTFDPSAAGLRTATITIASNDANEETYSFMIQGTGTAPTEWIIDDFSSGFRRTGSTWYSLSGQNMYGGGGLYAPRAGRPHAGHWTVSGLEPGRYRVMATWQAAANRGSNVPYALFDGNTRLRQVRVNQRLAPSGESGSGLRWHSLGTVTISGGSLRVTMTNAANGLVVADAVRVVREVPRPEMGMRGGTTEITAGDSTPGRSDGTDFGLVLVGGGSGEAAFTITNSGTGPLTLTGSPQVQITGSHASDFSVAAQPSSPVAVGATTTFRVTFNPSATGVRAARIVILNDDPDESPYEFAIQGTGVATLEPDIDVRWTTPLPSIPDGDTTPTPVDGTDFGAVAVGGSWTRTFTITNAGTASLSLAGSPRIEVSGSHPADFTIATMPAATVAPGSSTTFRLIFRPSAEGLRTARIVIPSNDPDENPYDFSIQGTGMLVIDNRGPGFRRTGSGWTSVPTDDAYGGSHLYAFKAGRASAAHWEFTGLEPGRYEVMTTWRPHSNRGTNVPYSIHDGGLRISETRVNQRLAPADDYAGGSFWHSLGTVVISRGSLRVTMTNAANGVVVADAVRIIRLETSAVASAPTTAAATRFALIAAAQEYMRDTKPATTVRGPRGR